MGNNDNNIKFSNSLVFRNTLLSTIMLITLVSILMITSILGASVTLKRTVEGVGEELLESGLQGMELEVPRVVSNVEESLKTYELILDMLSDHPDIKGVIAEGQKESRKLTQEERDMFDLLDVSTDNSIESRVFGPIGSSISTIDVIYLGTKSKETYVYPKRDLPTGYDPTQMAWYQNALKNSRQTVWEGPYNDVTTNNYILTVSKKVNMPTSLTEGVVALDVDISDIKEEILHRNIGEYGHLFFTDKDGVILGYPKDKELGSLGKDGELVGVKEILNFISSNELESELIEYTSNGVVKVVKGVKLERIGLIIFGEIEKAEINIGV